MASAGWCKASGRSIPIAPKTSAELHAVGQTRRRPVLELHAEGKTTPTEHVLDFRQRLLAKVRRLQQLDLGLLDQVADVVDAFGLEAVRRADRQFEIVDRTKQQRIETALLRLGRIALAAREIAENRQLVVDDFSCLRTASSAPIVPFVSISSTSLSRLVRCSTRAASTS